MTKIAKIVWLKINQILEEARGYIDIDEYMSEFHDGKLSYRYYVINVGEKQII